MRPIVRGPWPLNSSGVQIAYSDYKDARAEMINRVGEYCSYCEMQLDASLAIEHVQPKQPPGAVTPILALALNWNNFLLACTNCNSTKGNTSITLSDYFWPDCDNTFRAFQYSLGGVVSIAPTASGSLQIKAQNVITLTGLDKQPLNNPKASDRRWQNRKEAWEIASRSKDRLSRNFNNIDMREEIVEHALDKGYWSIWMSVFSNDPDMLQRLIHAFPGTCTTCFDVTNNYQPIARPGGQI